jgi:hypothetical protein
MLITAFFQWWYGAGWAQQGKAMQRRIRNIAGMFSVDILLRTMFSPWKQTVVYARRDQSLQDKFGAEVGNIVSRFVGLGVRFMVLFTAGIGVFCAGLYGLLGIILWPLIPFLPLILILVSLGVFG